MSPSGGVVGGVAGLSFAGLSLLPLSDVMPVPLPVPDMVTSEAEVVAPSVPAEILAGFEVVWASRAPELLPLMNEGELEEREEPA